jgi:hypothetical protein
MTGSVLTKDELLVLLIEECGEVIQAATKCLRFGFQSDHGLGYGRNDLVLAKEVGELQAVMEALYLDPDTVYWARLGKIARAQKAKKKYGRVE